MPLRIVAVLLMVLTAAVVAGCLANPRFVIWTTLLPVILFAAANAAAVFMLARRADLTRVRVAALWLIAIGTAAGIAFIAFPFWDQLLMPPRSEWRDSLPGLGRAILAMEIMLTLIAGGLGLGWGMWFVAGLRERRRVA